MSTKTRPELSEKNRFWIPKERYYELKHFCLQYNDWCAKIAELDGMARHSPGIDIPRNGGKVADPTGWAAEARAKYCCLCTMVKEAAWAAVNEGDLVCQQRYHNALMTAVSEGLSYEQIVALGLYDCSRSEWYKTYRKFFWCLNMIRD